MNHEECFSFSEENCRNKIKSKTKKHLKAKSDQFNFALVRNIHI